MILIQGEENYSEWLTNITAILQIKELDDYITRASVEQLANVVTGDNITNDDVAKCKSKQATWDKKHKVTK